MLKIDDLRREINSLKISVRALEAGMNSLLIQKRENTVGISAVEEAEDYALGIGVIALLALKPDLDGMVNTIHGLKSPIGLGRTIKSILEGKL